MPLLQDYGTGYYNGVYDGYTDVLILEFDPTGHPYWTTTVGGHDYDYGMDICTDAAGNCYITGFSMTQGTDIYDFPLVTCGTFNHTYGGGTMDAIAMKFEKTGGFMNFKWSSYLGGNKQDVGNGVSCDGNNIYICGFTKSNLYSFYTLPSTTSGAYYQNSLLGTQDAFIFKLSTGINPQWSTLYGGSDIDAGAKVVNDLQGNVYFTGTTYSSDFPLTNPLMPDMPLKDAFIANLSTNCVPLWSTYYGGSSTDGGSGIFYNNSGCLLVSGGTNSSDFPLQSNTGYYIWQPTIGNLGGGDGFALKFCCISPTADYTYSFDHTTCNQYVFVGSSGITDPTCVFSWNFGDGTSGTGQTVSHTFSEPGYFVISLTVSNECDTSCISNVINVIPSSLIPSYNPNCCSENFVYPQIIDPDIVYNGYDLEVPTGHFPSWNPSSLTVYYIKGTLTIKNGASLTITNNIKIEFGPMGRVIVEPGGRLNLIGHSIFTGLTNCGTMWQGIEVWGNFSISHATLANQAMQGQLSITERFIISNAHVAVLVGKTNLCFYDPCDPLALCKKLPYDLHYSGGIIKTSATAYFSKNAVNIKFLPFKYSNVSQVINCDFQGGVLLDPGYKTGNIYSYGLTNFHNPLYAAANSYGITPLGIYQWDVRKVTFNNNSLRLMETGMLSYGSPHNVSKSTFRNMNYGIRIFDYLTTVYGHDIYNNNDWNTPTINGFYNMKKYAIQIEGAKNEFIRKNTFEDKSNAVLKNYTGIYLNNTSPLHVYDNDFNYISTGINCINTNLFGGVIGAETRNTGIYTGNYFKECSTDIITSGKNKALQIHCNSSDNNAPSPFWSGTNWLNYGTFGTQGLFDALLGTCLPAGNYFAPSYRKLIKNTFWSYYYYAHSTPSNRIPDISSPFWNINTGSGSYSQSTSCYPCNKYENSLSGMLNDSIQIDALQNEYLTVTGNIDNGQTQLLLTAINSSMSQGNLKILLVNASPLSDTVLIATIERPNQLSPGNFKNVITPNSPVSDVVKPYLDTKLTTLPPGIASQILAAQSDYKTYRTPTAIIIEMEGIKNDYQLNLNNYIQLLIDNDSLSKALNVLKQQNSNEMMQMVIGTYLSDSNITEAQNLLTNFIPVTQEETDWKELNELLLDYSLNDKTVFDMSPVEEAFVRNLANDNSCSLASVNAQAILRLVFGEEFYCSEDGSNFKYYNETDTLDIKNDSLYLGEGYPNPAVNSIVIPYFLPKNCNNAKLYFTDVSGRLIKTYNLSADENQVFVSLTEFENGIYLYQLLVDETAIQAKKMVIIK